MVVVVVVGTQVWPGSTYTWAKCSARGRTGQRRRNRRRNKTRSRRSEAERMKRRRMRERTGEELWEKGERPPDKTTDKEKKKKLRHRNTQGRKS